MRIGEGGAGDEEGDGEADAGDRACEEEVARGHSAGQFESEGVGEHAEAEDADGFFPRGGR